METLKKKVNEIENCVREDLPHLLEIKKGCVLLYLDDGYEVIHIDSEFAKLIKLSNGDVFLFRLCFVQNHFEVVGHPVTMTHIFQWICEKHKNSNISFSMECNRWIMNRNTEKETESVDIPINEGKDFAHQPFHLIDFLHSLI